MFLLLYTQGGKKGLGKKKKIFEYICKPTKENLCVLQGFLNFNRRILPSP